MFAVPRLPRFPCHILQNIPAHDLRAESVGISASQSVHVVAGIVGIAVGKKSYQPVNFLRGCKRVVGAHTHDDIGPRPLGRLIKSSQNVILIASEYFDSESDCKFSQSLVARMGRGCKNDGIKALREKNPFKNPLQKRAPSQFRKHFPREPR
jgi:hypothetical protein